MRGSGGGLVTVSYVPARGRDTDTSLICTLVRTAIRRERGAISDELFGGLLPYAGLNTLLPSFVLRTAFDVTPKR